jgi:RNA polymerase sigma-70 factor, ECF subfamily
MSLGKALPISFGTVTVNVSTRGLDPVGVSGTPPETAGSVVPDSVTAGGAGPTQVTGGRQRAMNAVPPEDADRNLDFDALVEKYDKKIFNVIYRMLGDYEEATDLTQETFISAFRHYDRFRGDSKVFTWLYQIARNLCINRVRQRERQRGIRFESMDQPRDIDEEDGGTREIADWSQSPQRVLENNELREKLMSAIQSLTPEYREVLVLREFEGLSYNEIVERTGLTLENVKTRLSRARGMIRRKIGPYYQE